MKSVNAFIRHLSLRDQQEYQALRCADEALYILGKVSSIEPEVQGPITRMQREVIGPRIAAIIERAVDKK